MRARNIASLLRVVLLAGLAAFVTTCSSQVSQTEDLPPLVYICPTPEDASVLWDHPGNCPECGKELQPLRIARAYSCLNNTAFIQEGPGKCVTDGADLVPITVSVYWVCSDSPSRHELEPGRCSDGSERIKKLDPRPHGDHNPRHGGQFFMADDGWHHIEGTYPQAGLFRAYFYDDWSKPLKPEGFAARIVIKDASGKEQTSLPLHSSSIDNALEAPIPDASLPLNTTLHVRFESGSAEKFFDFQFPEYSKDPVLPERITSTPPAPLPSPTTPPPSVDSASASVESEAAVAAVVPPSPSPPPPPTTSNGQPPVSMDLTSSIPFREEPIPSTAREVLSELNAQSEELAKKIEGGAPLGQLWVPALRTKDLALALVGSHLTEIPASQRAAAENAAGRLLRAAYAIDNFGDLGDRNSILSAHDAFVSAVQELKSAYASIR